MLSANLNLKHMKILTFVDLVMANTHHIYAKNKDGLIKARFDEKML
jgi:hypothetical protein